MKALNLLVGHRGVGKTNFLTRMAARHPEEAYYADLDHEIERRSQQTIAELFARGEKKFREIELKVLAEIVTEAESRYKSSGLATWLAAGAGLEQCPPNAYVVWLRRETDRSGRVFLNRPRLSPADSPFSEYLALFPVREKRYADWADEILLLPEGYEGGLEEVVLSRRNLHIPFDVTLSAEDAERWPDYWSRRQKWNLRRIELRDDLVSEAQIDMVVKSLPYEQIIFSRRRNKTTRIPNVMTDHALELGPTSEADILSVHERRGTFADTLEIFKFQSTKAIWKLAVEVNNFNELLAGHRWWLGDPEGRAFLPRSPSGRWRWYRSLFGPRMPLHFIREGEGSALDQPTLAQTLLQAHGRGAFAAVLGSPINQSRSPLEHQSFFAARQMPFVGVEVTEEEISTAWPVLCELGLTHAAVTAPLKKWAAQVAPLEGSEVANTLWLKNGRWIAANTDRTALAIMAKERNDWGQVVVWGAGAMSANLKTVFPSAVIVSARQGAGDELARSSADTLIWATSRGREFQWPDFELKVGRILDLNYTDDSPGLEWAARTGVSYESGLRLFKLQADEQRRLWSSV